MCTSDKQVLIMIGLIYNLVLIDVSLYAMFPSCPLPSPLFFTTLNLPISEGGTNPIAPIF